jgi:glycosyltransferase involved in cell wall biosynthesis
VDGENGFLVPARDPAALAEALGKLIRSASLRRQMGVASRRLAEERFDEVDLVARTLALYE